MFDHAPIDKRELTGHFGFHSGGFVKSPDEVPSITDHKSHPSEMDELRKVLRYPEGGDLMRHAKEIRVLAAMLIDLK